MRATTIKPGDFVLVPFAHCDGTCAHCRAGMQSACVNVGITQSGQAEFAPELLELVIGGRIDPGRVLDAELPLDQMAEGYRAMDERRPIKVQINP